MKMPWLRDAGEGLLHLFFPRLCAGCSRPLIADESVLCLGCTMELPETGYHHVPDNDTALRFAGRIPFAYATSYAWFTNDGLLQHLIHGLKYGARREYGIWLGARLGEQIRAAGWGAEIHSIIPVPLHPAREAKRGYNQSELIARGVADAMGVNVATDLLQRVRETESQTHKTRAERVKNMKDAFRVNCPEKLAGKHVLLIDDVLTTGATIEACALALMQQESIKISIATIGIAVS